ncbi:MAG: hypothetical protein BWY82_02243 [Verrucomicrobia bacterium ADurb.Bin474]|nr:MAG: hypothetical protein BWY82_02243 [Verrucomicrobia bacterium ADurb.Bin474]
MAPQNSPAKHLIFPGNQLSDHLRNSLIAPGRLHPLNRELHSIPQPNALLPQQRNNLRKLPPLILAGLKKRIPLGLPPLPLLIGPRLSLRLCQKLLSDPEISSHIPRHDDII